MRLRWSALLAALLCVLHRAGGETGSSLVLVYAVTRHGARNVLPKTSTLREPPGGVTLLPLGQRQCYNAGLAFRTRYLDAGCVASGDAAPSNTCLSPDSSQSDSSGLYGVVGAPGVTWSNQNVLVRSSALDRTLLSARSFLAGIFPPVNVPTATEYLPTGEQPVPVFAVAGADADDTLIRTYTKCPTYDAALQRWYSSAEFADKEAATAAMRAAVSVLPGYPTGLDTALANWWNVFDAFNVARSGHGDPMPAVNATLWAQMLELANWLETRKMASALTGQLLGGPLLADLAARMAVVTAQSNLTAVRLVLLSAHYNTQLGILSALGVDGLPAAAAARVPWLTRLPATASMLAFELRRSRDGGAHAVRAVLQDGPAANYTAMPLPCASDAGAALAGEGACTLDAFSALLAPALAVAGTPAAWCSACNNAIAAQCVAAAALTAAAEPAAEATCRRHRREELSAQAVGVIVGVAVGLGVPTLALAARVAWLHWRGRRGSTRENEQPGGISLPSNAVWPHQQLGDG